MLDYPLDLQHGPGPRLAFLPEPDPGALAETAVAFANTDGGTLIIGMEAGGTIPAPLDQERIERALRQAAECCQPAIALDRREWIATELGAVLAIRVARSTQVPAMSDGRVLVRAACENRVLDGAAIRQLVAHRAHGEFEAEIVPKAKPVELDPDLVAEFMLRRAARLGQPWHGNDEDLLAQIGAVTPDGRVTVAGMLLFGHTPQHWLPQSGARLLCFVGRRPTDQHGAPGPAVEHVFGGALVRLVETVWGAVRAQMRVNIVAGDPQAEEYPAAAVREALVNAIGHRDYRLRGEIEVRMYADGLDITSPGGLPGFMTEAHLTEGRFSRNPRLAWGLFHWGYGEEAGQGIARMIDAMERHGRSRPEFDAGTYHVTVRLPNDRAAAPERAHPLESADLSQRQRAALEYVQQHGSITLRELQALYAIVRPDLLQQDLADLVRRGRLRKIGARASLYYILP